jgi:mannose-6-phosphate isomerase-like protein (cupin superfamily)
LILPSGAQVTKELRTNKERGVDLNLYVRCWQDSDSEYSHGGLLERPVLTAGDPQHVAKPGAVLLYARKFSRATLEGRTRTEPTRHSEQEVLYIVTGKGKVEGGGRTAGIAGGIAILLPPEMTHTLYNEDTQPMEVLIVTEQPPAGFKARPDMLVKNMGENPVAGQSHWSYAAKVIFTDKDGLARLTNLLLVIQDAWTIGSPHAHIPEWEEVWYKIEDDGILFLGSEVRKMPDGCGFILLRMPKRRTRSSTSPAGRNVTFTSRTTSSITSRRDVLQLCGRRLVA